MKEQRKMEITNFAEFLVKKITQQPDLVKVKQFETDDEIVVEIMVSESDMGRVIGKKGRIANSIKTLIQAKAYNDGIKNVRINIDSF